LILVEFLKKIIRYFFYQRLALISRRLKDDFVFDLYLEGPVLGDGFNIFCVFWIIQDLLPLENSV